MNNERHVFGDMWKEDLNECPAFFPFLITQDPQTDDYMAMPFWHEKRDIIITIGESELEAFRVAGDLAWMLVSELSVEQKRRWRECYDASRPNVYLIYPRFFCMLCQQYDECDTKCLGGQV